MRSTSSSGAGYRPATLSQAIRDAQTMLRADYETAASFVVGPEPDLVELRG